MNIQTRGAGKTFRGNLSTIAKWAESEDDPVGLTNNVVRRAFIAKEVICAVLKKDQVLHFETRMGFDGANYAQQAFAKHGPCRVAFYEANEAQMWREIRWKNANVGTLYRRPSFMTLSPENVPEQLRLAAMLL